LEEQELEFVLKTQYKLKKKEEKKEFWFLDFQRINSSFGVILFI